MTRDVQAVEDRYEIAEDAMFALGLKKAPRVIQPHAPQKPHAAPMLGTTRRILRFLARKDGSAPQIAKALKVDVNSVASILTRLVRKGRAIVVSEKPPKVYRRGEAA